MTDTLPAPPAHEERAAAIGAARAVAGFVLSFLAGVGGAWVEGKLGRSYPGGPLMGLYGSDGTSDLPALLWLNIVVLCIGALFCAFTAKGWRGFGTGLVTGFVLQVGWYAHYLYNLE